MIHEVADELGIAPSTVKTHLSNIYLRLEAKNGIEAALKARMAENEHQFNS